MVYHLSPSFRFFIDKNGLYKFKELFRSLYRLVICMIHEQGSLVSHRYAHLMVLPPEPEREGVRGLGFGEGNLALC